MDTAIKAIFVILAVVFDGAALAGNPIGIVLGGFFTIVSIFIVLPGL